jgi:hypothetical protein
VDRSTFSRRAPGGAVALAVMRPGRLAASTAPFDYGAEAELFSGAARPSRHQLLGYRRFASAAEALRFAIEELAPGALAGAALEVGDQRFGIHDMRRLYEASDYPLARRAPNDRASATTRLSSRGGRAVPGSGSTKKKVTTQDRE